MKRFKINRRVSGVVVGRDISNPEVSLRADYEDYIRKHPLHTGIVELPDQAQNGRNDAR